MEDFFTYKQLLVQVVGSIGVVGGTRWYTKYATRRGKIVGNIVMMTACAALIVWYWADFANLTYPPPNPLYWLALAFIIGLPMLLIGFTVVELRRLLRTSS